MIASNTSPKKKQEALVGLAFESSTGIRLLADVESTGSTIEVDLVPLRKLLAVYEKH